MIEIRIDALKEVLAAIHRYLVVGAGFGVVGGVLLLPGIVSSVGYLGLSIAEPQVAASLAIVGYFVSGSVASILISRVEGIVQALEKSPELVRAVFAYPSIATIVKPGYRLGIVWFPGLISSIGLAYAHFSSDEGLGVVGIVLGVLIFSTVGALTEQLRGPIASIVPSGGE